MDLFTSRNQDLKDLVIESRICIQEWKDVQRVSQDGKLAKSPLIINAPFISGMWDAYVMEHNHQNITLFFFYFENGTRASGRCIKRRKIRFSKTRIAYYSNSVATQALLLSGDVAKNPGPGQEKATNTKTITSSSKTTPAKCDLCEKTIRRNQKNILGVNCIGCFHWECVNWKPMVSDWLCDNCVRMALPLYKCPDAELLDDTTEFTRDAALSSPSDYAHPLRNKNSHFKIMHLNTKALASTFNEFPLTVNIFPQ